MHPYVAQYAVVPELCAHLQGRHVSICVHKYEHRAQSENAHMYTGIYVCVYIHVYMYKCINVYMYMSIYIHTARN